MHVEHRGDRTIADTQGMAALTARTPAAVRYVCRGLRGPDGYDHDACEALLDQHPADPATVSATDAERLPGIGIPANRIYQWVHVGLITAVDWHGRSPLYAVDDLVRLRNRLDRKAQLDL